MEMFRFFIGWMTQLWAKFTFFVDLISGRPESSTTKNRRKSTPRAYKNTGLFVHICALNVQTWGPSDNM